ncbi:MAG TPA: hypothetical protein VIY56_01905 [Vicinamibacterales bacterium]
MPRTTLDIDAPILRDLKKRQRREGKSLGRLVSDLLARALDSTDGEKVGPAFTWQSRPMGARVDIDDKEAVRAALDRP